MILAQGHSNISVEHNREIRNRPLHIWSCDLWQRHTCISGLEGTFGFSISSAGILGYPCEKRNEPWLLPYMIYTKLIWGDSCIKMWKMKQ